MQVINAFLTALLFAVVSAFTLPGTPSWHPPVAGDARGPCPLLNTLANYEYLPHNGRNVAEELIVDIFDSVLHFNSSLSAKLFQSGLKTASSPNATTFNLDDLNAHDVLEHDASLSRADFYFGDNWRFNQSVFDETRSYWNPVLNVQTAAKARMARIKTSNATNPDFTWTEKDDNNTFTQNAFLFLTFGDRVSGLASKEMVEYFFENERLPLDLGWTRPTDIISDSDMDDMRAKLRAATDKINQGGPGRRKLRSA